MFLELYFFKIESIPDSFIALIPDVGSQKLYSSLVSLQMKVKLCIFLTLGSKNGSKENYS